MEIGFLHLHKTVVVLFLALMLGKVGLLVAGKKELLQKVRDKTRVLDMVFGALILITGGYLFFLKSNPELYLYAKALLVLIAIPIGIIGFKKMNPLLAIISLLIIVYIYGIAETKSIAFKPKHFDLITAMESESGEAAGMVIYNNLCVDCHGTDGKKGLFKASDLTQSKLTNDQKLEVITKGKGIMQPYSKRLNEDEIQLVLEYINTLK